MKTSKEKAEEFLAERALKESYAEELADFIKQDRAELRQLCADAAYALVKEFECVDSYMAKGVMEVCLNAGVEDE